MITKEEIQKLADLSRISITDEEKEQFGKEIDSILNYVTQIKEANISFDAQDAVGSVKNIMREDQPSHDSGIFTEEILDEAPKREGNYIKVKKIL